MNRNKFLLLALSLFLSHLLQAQLEVAHLRTKGYSATGFGTFLHIDIPLNEADFLTLDGGFYYFKKDDERIAIAPLKVGYKKTLDGTGTGWYVEPTLGYTLGGSEIEKYDEEGSLLYENGQQVYQKVKGPTAGVGAGYMFPSLPLNLGFQYQMVKAVKRDPSLHVFSLRLSYSRHFGRNDY